MDGTIKDHHKAPRSKKTTVACSPSTVVLAPNFQMCTYKTCKSHRNQERNHVVEDEEIESGIGGYKEFHGKNRKNGREPKLWRMRKIDIGKVGKRVK